MSGGDPELIRLLLEELKGHLTAIDAAAGAGRGPLEPDSTEVLAARRAVHALKGAAGLAGQRELSSALERLSRRAREGDPTAFAETAALVRTAIARMSAGKDAVLTRWPEPPDDLLPRPIDPLVFTQYAADVTDRLARIDQALAMAGDPAAANAEVYRQVHTMKGAASAVGDDPMSWFCHGLEERLKAGSEGTPAAGVFDELARWRPVLGALLDDPDGALDMLRSPQAKRRVASSRPPRSSLRPFPMDEESRGGEGETTIRVSAVSVDRLLDRLETIDLVRETVGSRAERARQGSRGLREARAALVEALRLIGPPRPWGAPAAALRRVEDCVNGLSVIADELEEISGHLAAGGADLKEGVAEAKKRLSAMRQMPMGRVFARLTTAIESEARRIDRAVIVRTRGADETVDRRLAELLVEPCLQIVRNAVAHGIEPADARTAAGKPASGTVELTARKIGNRLHIVIQDDGAGVDVATLRERAIAMGALAPEIADAADDDTLLSLLFLPGLSTQGSSDLLAGRGIGLDITRGAVQRLGGAIRLSSRRGAGFTARISVPSESGLASLLWVTADGVEYAIPAANVATVRANDGPEAGRVPHLAACLESRPNTRAPYALEIELGGDERTPDSGATPGRSAGPSGAVVVGVDHVGTTEELLVRPLTPLVAGLGPFAGAIVRGDGSLRLAVDAYALAPRARALEQVAETRSSEHPSDRPH